MQIPVFLGRGPDEPPDDELRAFFERLLRAVADATCGTATGGCANHGWPDNDTHRSSSPGAGEPGRHVVVVNLRLRPRRAAVHLPWPDLGAG